MSKLGNINLSYGKQINIAVANTYSYILLNSGNLPPNTIIVSSPIDNKYDTGSYSMIITDNDGNPVRLTYCIKEGNGLYSTDNKDVIKLNIDDNTIKVNNDGLYVDLSIYNHNSVYVNENKLNVDTSMINSSSKDNRGIISIDDNTVKSANDKLYINTENLTFSDNNTMTYGILVSSDESFTINNGIISLNVDNLPHATNDNYGIVKGDESTISCTNDYVQINTDNLSMATKDEFGIILPDNKKIKSVDGVLMVESDKLNTANTTNKGIISIDGSSININKNGQITINNYSNMIDKLNEINNKILSTKKSLDDIKNTILITSK